MAKEKTMVEMVKEMVEKEIKGTKIVAQESKTGTSWFQGKKRLCKVLNTKKGVSIEVNVVLPKEIEKEYNLTKISAVQAHKKHLGTMKYMIRLADEKQLPKILKAMVDQFKKEVVEKVKEEEKQAQ